MPAFENAIDLNPRGPTRARLAPSARWERAFDALVDFECFDAPQRSPNGSWTAHAGCILASPRRIMASLPGEYSQITDYWEDMFDATGEAVDYELESSVWSCDAERSIFSYIDHWQAGLTGAVSVYAREDDYRSALEVAVREAAVMSGKGTNE
jgi:hypothetical protein